MKKKAEGKAEKKGLWAMIKESMTKTSSGCGPGCGCHSEKPVKENQQDDANEKPGKEKVQS
jgi:heterodisulfide reductase subunit B